MFPALVGLDLLGVFRGWRTFDHLAHLGGSFFGLAYLTFLREIMWYGTLERYIQIKHGLAVKSSRN
jgi:membrane associated rhomboid family serine protease